MYGLTIPAELNNGTDEMADNKGRGHTARDTEVIIREMAKQRGYVCADHWQPFGYGNAERLLIWADEDSMNNDDGQKAIAVAVREPIA